jgi:hypothetical protein
MLGEKWTVYLPRVSTVSRGFLKKSNDTSVAWYVTSVVLYPKIHVTSVALGIFFEVPDSFLNQVKIVIK